ncbi:hypothetical protein RhiirA5_427641 [Rhizophagus irregularis]|uniref:Uncharacterized protein n=1 Tax=Rhizophagus irregularis TaxID=588596 RepID=A0A2N0P1Y4_9GLOM|nr:hypothetical protein RhiirA5_427641 [Rhizophagus irregularis]GET57453.1 hypothetical protein RIR_e2901_A0A2N0P1Y4_9GLOM [Rhizophagus irregularis DAOM 181602=DAOM 197198]
MNATVRLINITAGLRAANCIQVPNGVTQVGGNFVQIMNVRPVLTNSQFGSVKLAPVRGTETELI